MAALGKVLWLIAALVLGGSAMAADLENTLYMDVPAGRVVIEMRPDLAPQTVQVPLELIEPLVQVCRSGGAGCRR